MSKYFQIALVLGYVVLTITAFEGVLVASGWRCPIYIQWLIVIGWVLFCFLSAYMRVGFQQFFYGKFRKPLLAEEKRLLPAMEELLRKAGSDRRVCLRIDESRELNACATGFRTIAITRPLLDGLSPSELRGVLAHELGHLLSGDTIAAAAFATAGLLPQAVFRVYRLGIVIVRKAFVRAGLGVAVVLLLGYGLYRVHLLKAVIPILVFVVLFAVLNRVFGFFARLLARMAEYRQDTFAHRLGYGDGLRKALEKLAASSEPVVNRYYIVMHSTHPVIYNRIRRLERRL